MDERLKKLRRPFWIMVLGTAIGAALILLFTAENPLRVFAALVEGSLVGKLKLFVGLGAKGLLAAMIVKCNPVLIPFSAFFVSMLSSGALHMQQTTSVSKAFADTLCAIFIVIASMEELFKKSGGKQRTVMKKKGKGIFPKQNPLCPDTGCTGKTGMSRKNHTGKN
ncbi:MAG: hypothetical protein HFI39_02465 [Lachnospiraceae bacterium]|nr:hypothetical protein [Lachnospiraceae bacterium]